MYVPTTFAIFIVGSSKCVQTLGLLVPFIFFHVPPVCQRIVFKISVFVIQCLLGNAPSNLAYIGLCHAVPLNLHATKLFFMASMLLLSSYPRRKLQAFITGLCFMDSLSSS